MYYLDTSAAFKLFTAESESDAMRDFFESIQGEVTSSTLLITELIGNLKRIAPKQVPMAQDLLSSLFLMNLSQEVLRKAADLVGSGLRSLDSIHLAAMIELGAPAILITYDKKLAEVSSALGFDVVSPGATSVTSPSA